MIGNGLEGSDRGLF